MATSFPSFASFSISHRSFSSPVHILHHSPSLLSLLSSTPFRNCIAYVILDLRSASSLYPLPFSLYLHLLRYIHLIHYLHRLRLLQILRYIFLLHSLCFSDTPPFSLLSPFCLNFAVLLSLFFGSFFLFVTFTFVSSPSSIFASFVVTVYLCFLSHHFLVLFTVFLFLFVQFVYQVTSQSSLIPCSISMDNTGL